MANYISSTRTNYFHVTDAEAFKDLMKHCTAEDEIQVFEEPDGNGETMYAFGTYGLFQGYCEDNEDDSDMEYAFDDFVDRLQQLLRPDDACVIYNAGWEKLRYVGGGVTIITKDKVKSIGLIDIAVKKARELLDDPAWETKNDY